MTMIPVLVRPQMGENIGATARAMANFGLSQLRLVAPRDGWPNPKAGDVAGKALPILDDAALFATTREALADCQFVLATTARTRAMNLPAFTPREAVAEMRMRQARGERCAVLFGPERTGLENEEVTLANGIVTIPVAPEYPSLNIAQAVVVILYEWFAAEAAAPVAAEHPVAARDVLQGLFDQLESALDASAFWRVAEKKEILWRNIRAVLTRAGLSAQEVATWRGIVRALEGLKDQRNGR